MPITPRSMLSYSMDDEGTGYVWSDRRDAPIATFDNVRSIEHLTHLYESKRVLHLDIHYTEPKSKPTLIDLFFKDGKITMNTLLC